MSKLLVTTVCALLALPVAAIADDGHRYYGYPGGYRYYGHAGAPHYYYGYPGYYYGGGHHHDHDDDDALWAIGGLVLGGLIVHAVEQASAEASASAPAASSPPKQCRDSVAYDSDGTPYVKRDCK
jgi:hypothetical protein